MIPSLPRRRPHGDWVLTLQCSVCGSPSAWHDEQDGREYCPACTPMAPPRNYTSATCSRQTSR